jgi:hypothetical protein
MTHRHQLTCTQFVELADAFALEALDELEQRACARHIGRSVHHAGCREALANARVVMDGLASTLPGGAPPAALWDAIEARLGAGPGSRSSDAEWL